MADENNLTPSQQALLDALSESLQEAQSQYLRSELFSDAQKIIATKKGLDPKSKSFKADITAA